MVIDVSILTQDLIENSLNSLLYIHYKDCFENMRLMWELMMVYAFIHSQHLSEAWNFMQKWPYLVRDVMAIWPRTCTRSSTSVKIVIHKHMPLGSKRLFLTCSLSNMLLFLMFLYWSLRIFGVSLLALYIWTRISGWL